MDRFGRSLRFCYLKFNKEAISDGCRSENDLILLRYICLFVYLVVLDILLLMVLAFNYLYNNLWKLGLSSELFYSFSNEATL